MSYILICNFYSDRYFNSRLNFAWKDQFLSWNASQAEDIEQLRMDIEDIWIPDIEVFNLVSRKELRDREQVVDGLEKTMFDPQLLGCSGELRRHPLGSPLHPLHHL